MTDEIDSRPLRRKSRSRIRSRQQASRAGRFRRRSGPLKVAQVNPRLAVLVLVCASFFILWLFLRVFAQADLWPLLAAPILLSAWFFYEAGVVLALGATVLLLAQTSFEKPGSVTISLITFAAIGLGVARAVRRQRRAYRRVLRSSLTDALTGLYNYGFFIDALDREIHRVRRYGGSISLVMLDIDHFKMFNDRFGHQAGNDALKAVGLVLRREKRESDVAARFGGEEFVLLLPGNGDAGMEMANRMRRAISRIQVPLGGGATTGITVSAGVAGFPQNASSREELLDVADQLLYESKRKGRDKITASGAKRRLAV